MRGQTIRDREYLFIDGGCLRAATAAMSEAITGSRDVLAPFYSCLAGEADKVFYYDAIPAQEHEEVITTYEARVQEAYDRFDKIRALDRFHVALGEVKGRGRNRRQKQVDVRLAVDMLTHTFRGNMQRASLFAGDDDFIPLIDALVREGMTVTVWHPPQASEQLLGAADNRRPFDLKSAHMMLTRDNACSAFRFSSSAGRVGPIFESDPYFQRWIDPTYTYAAKWTGEELTIYRSLDENTWTGHTMLAPKAPIEEALVIFGESLGWNISNKAAEHFPKQSGRP